MRTHFLVNSVVLPVACFGAGVFASLSRDDSRDTRNLEARLRAVEAVLTPENGVKLIDLLPHVSVVDVANGNGTTSRTVRFSEVNVQIVNGLGATNGRPDVPDLIHPGYTRVNGLGNLIVGYNESPPGFSLEQTGSHNIVVGVGNRYLSFGGIVAGYLNKSSAAYASVTGGRLNTASGPYSTVGCGDTNVASGFGASVWGGTLNSALGAGSVVTGGDSNRAIGGLAVVAAGSRNNAIASYSSVAGGERNDAKAHWSTIGGGSNNVTEATAFHSSISGGCRITTTSTCEQR